LLFGRVLLIDRWVHIASQDLVSAYCDKGWIRRGIGSSAFNRKFENLDGDIDRSVLAFSAFFSFVFQPC